MTEKIPLTYSHGHYLKKSKLTLLPDRIKFRVVPIQLDKKTLLNKLHSMNSKLWSRKNTKLLTWHVFQELTCSPNK